MTAAQKQWVIGSGLRWDGRLLASVGILVGCAGAAMALGATGWAGRLGLGALTLAILLGMAVGHAPGHQRWLMPGAIQFARHTLLRAGVVLYGARLTLAQIHSLGASGVAIPLLVLAATMLSGVWLGTRVFGLSRSQAVLVAAGSAVCGAAAVLAVAPAVKASPRETAVAIASVVLFGTAGIFLYPWLYALAGHAGVAVVPAHFGVYIGSTLHEVAQVIAAARPLGDDAANAAVVSKMVRVLALAPLLVVLACTTPAEGAIVRTAPSEGALRRAAGHAWRAMPWFAVGLLGVTLLNSAGAIPVSWHAPIDAIDTAMLACAMFAIGTQTHVPMLLKSGVRPLLCAAVLWVGLVAGGAAINVGVRWLAG
ncbi:YeiH family protein [Ralstonia solanacearum]|uniref:YeiH family protein n=1 Tax=Ralstonia solanacearum TaxID=305 RepID=UPI00044BDCF7|nr:YeiH family protein [Ralstonia solanacearum]EUJ14406.1 membrane protein [Ralstonia solanacearum P673]MCL9846450.1 YeiH family protein [Ralstonia solanacearum]MCL9850842.1 YeiH family protein [Ralstonia solanacearum]MCL9852744.1 YeiH family protein [Ralstonia solanacearum]MCL9860888.1 YeiH family protein [Ralstonia solanacearum]